MYLLLELVGFEFNTSKIPYALLNSNYLYTSELNNQHPSNIIDALKRENFQSQRFKFIICNQRLSKFKSIQIDSNLHRSLLRTIEIFKTKVK